MSGLMTDDKKTVAEGNQDANDEDIRETPTEAAQNQPDAGREDPAAPQAAPTPGARPPPPAGPVVDNVEAAVGWLDAELMRPCAPVGRVG